MKAILAQILGFALVATAFAQDFERCSPDEHLMDPPECPPFEQIPTYFPYPYDCTKYFECTNGDARCIQCAPGTRWDQELKTCNHEHATECVIVTTSRPTTPEPTTTEPTTTTTTTEPTTTTTTTEPTTTTTTTEPTTTTTTTEPTTTTTTTTTEPTTTTTTTTTEPTTTTTTTEPTTPSTSSTTEDPAEWICPEGYLGPIGHPYDCTHFYICDPGRRPCLFACTDGLYWSPITKDCEWPHDVPSCQGGTPPPPASSRSPVNYRNIQRFHKSVLVSSDDDPTDPCKPQVRYY